MRLLAAQIFSEEESGRFAQTQLSDALRADAPGSPRDFLRMIGREPFLAGDDCSTRSVPDGRASNSCSARRASTGSGRTRRRQRCSRPRWCLGDDVVEPVATAYPFGDLGLVVDVGGGHGRLLSAILARYPDVKGILFDLPGGIAAAEAGLGGPLPRCKLVAGDFFDRCPKARTPMSSRRFSMTGPTTTPCASSPTAVARWRRAAGLCGRDRGSARQCARPDQGDGRQHARRTGGRERTADEFAALFEPCRPQGRPVVPTGARVSILEAFAA